MRCCICWHCHCSMSTERVDVSPGRRPVELRTCNWFWALRLQQQQSVRQKCSAGLCMLTKPWQRYFRHSIGTYSAVSSLDCLQDVHHQSMQAWVQIWPACRMLWQKFLCAIAPLKSTHAKLRPACRGGLPYPCPAEYSKKALFYTQGTFSRGPACAALAQCACLHSLPLHPFKWPAGTLC